MYKLKIVCGNANSFLAGEMVEHLGKPLCVLNVTTFSDGEIKVQIDENVRGMDVFIIQPTCNPVNNHLMELLIIIDALKRASADRITAVMPYYGYARQDRKVSPRTAIAAKLVADLITAAGANRVLAMDLHTDQIQGFFNIPVDHVFASSILSRYLRENYVNNMVIVAPEANSVQRARYYGKQLQAPLAVCDRRIEGPDETETMNIVGEVSGKIAVVASDMIDTAVTLAKVTEALLESQATEVIAVATHAVLSDGAVEKIAKSPVRKVILTDTIPRPGLTERCDKFRILSVSRLLAEAVRRVHFNEPISTIGTMFER